MIVISERMNMIVGITSIITVVIIYVRILVLYVAITSIITVYNYWCVVVCLNKKTHVCITVVVIIHIVIIIIITAAPCAEDECGRLRLREARHKERRLICCSMLDKQ